MAGKRDNPNNNAPKKSKESAQSTELFNQYSRSLDKSADALIEASRNFDKVASRLDGVFEEFSEKQEGTTSEAGKKLDKTMEGYTKENHAYREALAKSLTKVANYAVDHIMDAGSKIIASYNQNFRKITARMNQSASDYTAMMQKVTDDIKSMDLTVQFSQVDFTESLQAVLDTGIRDIGNQTMARDMALQNLITNKIVPSIQTNTRTYTKLSKSLGSTFTEGITAIVSYAEENFGAEGLEEGGLESFLQTLGKNIYAAASLQGMTDKQAQEEAEKAIATYFRIAQETDRDTALDAMGALKDYLEGNINAANAIAAGAAGLAPGDMKNFLGDQVGVFADAYLGLLTEAMDSTSSAYVVKGMGYSMDTAQTVAISNGFNEEGFTRKDFDRIMSKYDSEEEYQKELGNLQKGYYQNITDQQAKWNENLVADVASLAAEKIPDTVKSLNLIFGIISAFFTAWMAKSAADSIKGHLGGGGGLPGGGGLVKGGLGKGGSLTGAGTALSAAAIFAGLAMVGTSAYEGYGEAISKGATKGEAWHNAARSAASGGASVKGWSDEEKIKEAEKRSKSLWNLDWSAVGKATTAGAAVGGGTGALIGSAAGGIGAAPGAAIGAGVGALAGAASSIAVQVGEMHDYNQYVESEFYNAAETMKDLTSQTTEYYSTLDEVNKLEESTSEKQEALNGLKGEEYAQLQASLTVEKALLEAKKAELGLGKNSAKETLDAAKGKLDEGLALQNAFSVADQLYKNNKWNDNTNYYEVATDIMYDQLGLGELINSGTINAIYKSDGKTIDKRAMVAAFMQTRAGDVTQYAEGAQAGGAVGKDYYSKIETSSFSMASYNDMKTKSADNVKAAIDTYNAVARAAALTAAGYKDDDVESKFLEMQKTAKDYYTAQKYMLETDSHKWEGPVNEGFLLEDLFTGLSSEGIKKYKELAKKNNSKASHGYYKLGTDYLRQDGLIYAHEGEAVLPKATAEIYRGLSAGYGGISGLLSAINEDATKKSSDTIASVLPQATALASDSIVNAIREHTQMTLQNFTMIIDLLHQINKTPSSSNSVTISRKLVNYEGV